MPKKRSTFSYRKSRKIIVGDLVYHLLYGKEWFGLLLDFKREATGLCTPRELGLIQIQPNTQYEDIFSTSLTKYRITDARGYVAVQWLYKVEMLK